MIFVRIQIALELRDFFKLLGTKHRTAIRPVGYIPFETRHHPIVHSDIEIGQHEDGGLEALREVESFRSELETFPGIGREQQNVAGVAVRGISAFHQVALLRASGHSGGWSYALHVDNHGGNFGVVSQSQQFVHQRNAGTGGGSERSRAIPGRADHHSDGGQLILGLDDDVVVLPGFRIAAVCFAQAFERV